MIQIKQLVKKGEGRRSLKLGGAETQPSDHLETKAVVTNRNYPVVLARVH